MNEVRIEIWDFLYRAECPQTIDEITQNVDGDEGTVRAAIDHHWFAVVEETVTIAYGAA